MKHTLIQCIPLTLILVFISFAESTAEELWNCLATEWPHETSELEPDPSIHYGRLNNGLRFVLKSNGEPRDRVAVYLNVEAGSLFEKENERGLAHFLEHMLFNGTTHFPPGKLIDYFRSIGMSFGGDVNGYTTYTDSVYKLIIPTGNGDSLDQALLVMRDYADGALLLDEEIERERGVILAEKTARDSARYRSGIARTSFVLRNTPLPERQPIGDQDVLMKADSKDLRGFYQSWYRPDNIILILVGDFDLETAETLIGKHFDSMQNLEPPICPEFGATDHSGIETFYHFEPDLGVTEVAIETVRNKSPENDSLQLQQENVLRYMASLIINYRLARLQESVDTPFSSAAYYDTVMFDRFRISGIRASTKKENWQQSLAQIESELRKVLSYGVSASELERVKKDLQADLENGVLSADTRNSLNLIGQIAASLDAHRVLQSPRQELELFSPFIKEVTIADLNRVVRNSWENEIRLIEVIGDAELPGSDGGAGLLAYYKELNARNIDPPDQWSVPSFPYLSDDYESASPVETTSYGDIGVQRVDYANGLVLNMKVTDFKKNQVSAALHFGDGRRSLPKQGLDLLASSVINGSGTASLTASQLKEALSGSSVRYNFRVADEAFVLSGQTVSAELELLFQVLQTILNDPGFRSSVYEISMKNFESMYRRLDSNIEGAASLYLDNFFSGGATGTGLPSWDRFVALQLDDAVSWLKPYFQKAPLELNVVGDFDPDRVVELAAKYFDPPKERSFVVLSTPEAQFPLAQQKEVAVQSIIDKALVRYGWLTDDYHDIGLTRRLHVLAATIEERLRQKIREELGASYSPSVYSVSSKIYPDYGAIYADVIVDGATVDTALAALEEIELSFAENPVDNDELVRARAPILTSLKDGLRTNGYWLHSVLSLSSRNQERLVWPLSLIGDFGAISSTEINQLARRYIRPDRRAVGIVRTVPEKDVRSVDQSADRAGILPHNDG